MTQCHTGLCSLSCIIEKQGKLIKHRAHSCAAIAKLLSIHKLASDIVTVLIYPVNISSERYIRYIFHSSQRSPCSSAPVSERCLKRKDAVLPFVTGLEEAAPQRTLNAALCKAFLQLFQRKKSEQLWQCNSIKRAYLISLVSVSLPQPSALLWQQLCHPAGICLHCWSTGASLQREEPASWGRSARDPEVSQMRDHWFAFNPGAMQTPSSDMQLLRETTKSRPYPMPQFLLL